MECHIGLGELTMGQMLSTCTYHGSTGQLPVFTLMRSRPREQPHQDLGGDGEVDCDRDLEQSMPLLVT